MRPLDSSRSCILGMLFVTLVSRRRPQKPLPIVTARTATLCSLEYGDFARFSIPWSFQAALSERPRYREPRSEEHTLNSSHQIISYAVFCLKKKKQAVATTRVEVESACLGADRLHSDRTSL